MDRLGYLSLKSRIIEAGYGPEISWMEGIGPPADAFALFAEYGWVVVNSGMRNQVALRIWERILGALVAGRQVATAFGHDGKAAAIQAAWDGRERRFAEFEEARRGGEEAVMAWIDDLPWIGRVTRFHLAKNLGVDCAKPDRWLERVAETTGESVEGLCRRLSAITGDRVATVDLVIWRACNLGLWP